MLFFTEAILLCAVQNQGITLNRRLDYNPACDPIIIITFFIIIIVIITIIFALKLSLKYYTSFA